MEAKKLSLAEARKTGQLAEFIRQHSDELAEDGEFKRLLEKMERSEKANPEAKQ